MTYEECRSTLVAIRRRQGTRCPAIRVDFGGAIYQGRLSRADSDPEFEQGTHLPFGVLVLEGVGLARSPEAILQIASIPTGGIRELDEN